MSNFDVYSLPVFSDGALSLFKKKTSEFTFDDGVVYSLKEDS